MHLKLASKYTCFSCGVLIITMLVFTFFHITKLKRTFLDEAVYEADTLNEILQRTTYHQMLNDDREQLQQVIDEAGQIKRIERIRIFGREGVIRFSTDHHEIGTALNNKAAGCAFCHLNEKTTLLDTTAENRSRTFIDATGKNVLGMTKGIYNEESCYTAACHFHKSGEKKLGVLDVVVSLDQMSSMTLDHYADMFISASLLLLVLSIFQYFFIKKYVSNPLNKLLEDTYQLGQGNLDARIDSWPQNEFGTLCLSFNQMAQNLAQSRNELREWGNTLERKVSDRTEEIKAMQAQLVQAAKLASLGELVAGIAHEINNPLSGILMFSSLAIKSPDLSPQVKENLEVIVSETRRCAKIVSALLEFSRESIPEKQPCSINQILNETLKLVSKQELFHNIKVKSQFLDSLPDICADSAQVQQVFFNMMINAGQAMEGRGVLQLSTELGGGNQSIIIKIIDNGVGISKEHLDKIFDPFFSTKGEKGFGLGLSISYGIIKNHGGEIQVQSQIDEGTKFTITLPLQREDVSSATRSCRTISEDGEHTEQD
ncbi:ATP-binding protein [Geopsychrobacter electrodiphilus]|uniref:ATP-binding protein n=1 Tax=Geopsychrobacter electrodiphilus TaxID=225196 RepID=UPI0003779457|nr:ATP-binding protein [Geopsychrobacter electrodiphilus]